jgi:hypothetical protein
VAVANVLLVSGSANFSTRDVWEGYRHGLEMCGVNVIPYPTFSFLKVLSQASVDSDIIGTALNTSNAIDCVIFVDGLYFRGKHASVPQSIRAAGVPTVLVSTDDPYEQIADADALYTWRFTNEVRCAVEGAFYLPTATLPLPEVPRVSSPRYDVSFLGTVFEDRLPLLLEVAEFCERERRRFLIAGKILDGTEPFEKFSFTEVRQRTIDSLEKWEIYSQSRVTLNIFRKTAEQPADSPNPRVFEATAFGQAALVTGPRRREVTRIYGDCVYHFDDSAEAITAIQAALDDEPRRIARVEQAREITLREHLYEHRAEQLVGELRENEHRRSNSGTAEHRIAWIIGCGRTGSTWLAEMLGDLPGIRHWHEPYYGRFFRHLAERPEELERKNAFFSEKRRTVWLDGLRDLFFNMVRDRYPAFGRHSLVVKEVNTPELYRWLRQLFPAGRMILLARDPFDVLDSYLDLQKPGSWNSRFGADQPPAPTLEELARRTSEHILSTMSTALSAYDAFPVGQRTWVSYEELLGDPIPRLAACAGLIGAPFEASSAAEVVEKHRFARHKQTGTLQFRRRGQAGVWRDSPNFIPEVLRIAEDTLGPLRARLGYNDAPSSAAEAASRA